MPTTKKSRSKITGPRIVRFTIIGQGPLMFGRQVFTEKDDDETPQQFEERTVLEKVTVNGAGLVSLNSDAIKRSLEWSASWRNDKLPGGAGGKATFKKRFTAGVQALSPNFELTNGKPALKPEDLRIQKLPVPPDGVRGGKRRVVRWFPTLDHPWEAECVLAIMDQAIDDLVFENHIVTSGMYDGIGSMRIGNGGPNGRYTVKQLRYEALEA